MIPLRAQRFFSRPCHSPIPRCAAVALIALAWIGGLTVTSVQNSQPSTTFRNGRTILPGEISIGAAIPAIETKSFICTPFQPFKKGDKLPATFELDRQGQQTSWSVSKHPLQIGADQVVYPVIVIGLGHTLLTAVVKAKTDINAGETLRSDGYQIETKRAVRAGDSISVLFIIGNMNISLLSIESDSDGRPWFRAFMDDMKPDARTSAIEAWRMVRQHVARDSRL